MREISRVLDDHNEANWVKYATTHTVRQVEKAVAKPPASLRKPISRLEYPTLFDVSACHTTAQAGVQQRVILMPGPDRPTGLGTSTSDDETGLPAADESTAQTAEETGPPTEDDSDDETAGDDYTQEENEAMAQEYFAQQRALKPWLYEKRPLPDWITPDPTDKDEQPDEEPPPTRLIRMTFVFKPDEYAAVEAGLRKAQGQMRKRHTQSEQLVHIMQQFLATGNECTKARYPVVIQIEGHDAVYVTDRGDLPVPPDKLQGLLAQARPPRKSPSARLLRSAPSVNANDANANDQKAGQRSQLGQPPVNQSIAVKAPVHESAEQPASQISRVGPASVTQSIAMKAPQPASATEQPASQMSHVGYAVMNQYVVPEHNWIAEQPASQMPLVGQPSLNESMVSPHNTIADQPASQMSHVGQALVNAYMVPKRNTIAEQPTSNMPHVGQPVLNECMAHEQNTLTEQPTDRLPHVGQPESARSNTAATLQSKRRTAGRPNAIRELMARSGWACVRCGSRERLELDHAVPICRGGSDDVTSQDPLCIDCHRARHHDDFKNDPLFKEGRRRAQERRSQPRVANLDVQRSKSGESAEG